MRYSHTGLLRRRVHTGLRWTKRGRGDNGGSRSDGCGGRRDDVIEEMGGDENRVKCLIRGGPSVSLEFVKIWSSTLRERTLRGYERVIQLFF